MNKRQGVVQRKRVGFDHAAFCWCPFKMHLRVIGWRTLLASVEAETVTRKW